MVPGSLSFSVLGVILDRGLWLGAAVGGMTTFITLDLLVTKYMDGSGVTMAPRRLRRRHFILRDMGNGPIADSGGPPRVDFNRGVVVSNDVYGHFDNRNGLSGNRLATGKLTVAHVVYTGPRLGRLSGAVDRVLGRNTRISLATGRLALTATGRALACGLTSLVGW